LKLYITLSNIVTYTLKNALGQTWTNPKMQLKNVQLKVKVEFGLKLHF